MTVVARDTRAPPSTPIQQLEKVEANTAINDLLHELPVHYFADSFAISDVIVDCRIYSTELYNNSDHDCCTCALLTHTHHMHMPLTMKYS